MDDLAAEMKGGDLNYDVVIASGCYACRWSVGPDSRSAWPDAEPEGGYCHSDVATAVKNAKAGQVRFRTDKNGIIHTSVGKVGSTPLL